MLSHMKTTINMSDSLFSQVKKLAENRGTTFKAVVESAVRMFISVEDQKKRSFKLKTHTFSGEGLQDGLKESDWSEIRRRIYEGRGS